MLDAEPRAQHHHRGIDRASRQQQHHERVGHSVLGERDLVRPQAAGEQQLVGAVRALLREHAHGHQRQHHQEEQAEVLGRRHEHLVQHVDLAGHGALVEARRGHALGLVDEQELVVADQVLEEVDAGERDVDREHHVRDRRREQLAQLLLRERGEPADHGVPLRAAADLGEEQRLEAAAGADLVGGRERGEPAAVEQGDPVADHLGLVQLVGAQDHGVAAAEAGEDVAQLDLLRGVEARPSARRRSGPAGRAAAPAPARPAGGSPSTARRCAGAAPRPGRSARRRARSRRGAARPTGRASRPSSAEMCRPGGPHTASAARRRSRAAPGPRSARG